MTDEQLPFAKTAITRIVMEKIPKAKRWSVSKEFKGWIDDLPKEQFEKFLDRLRELTNKPSNEDHHVKAAAKASGSIILFKTHAPAEDRKFEHLARLGGESTAYYALAVWRSIQVEELQRELEH